MKIAVNLLYLEKNTSSGIGKHIEDILTGWQELNVLDEFTLLVNETFYSNYFYPDNGQRPFAAAHLIICPEGWLCKALTAPVKKGQRFFVELYLNHFVLPSLLKNHDFDLVLFPFNGSSNNTSPPIPYVTVIHDLFYKNFPNQKSNIISRLYARYVDFKHRSMLKKSKKIITISNFVKTDILKHFPDIAGEKIAVIPNAVVISEACTPPEGVNGPFLLYVSEQAVHKNHITLLSAYNIIKNQTPHRLVLLGGEREETLSIRKYICDNHLGGSVIIFDKISNSQRNWLYQHTALMISPSLHEGFGRTPIEAALLGAMVLTSRETSLPEVTAELLNYYEPARDAQALAAKILQLLAKPTPPAEREKIRRYFQAIYHPVRIAQMYYDLFADLIDPHRN